MDALVNRRRPAWYRMEVSRGAILVIIHPIAFERLLESVTQPSWKHLNLGTFDLPTSHGSRFGFKNRLQLLDNTTDGWRVVRAVIPRWEEAGATNASLSKLFSILEHAIEPPTDSDQPQLIAIDNFGPGGLNGIHFLYGAFSSDFMAWLRSAWAQRAEGQESVELVAVSRAMNGALRRTDRRWWNLERFECILTNDSLDLNSLHLGSCIPTVSVRAKKVAECGLPAE